MQDGGVHARERFKTGISVKGYYGLYLVQNRGTIHYKNMMGEEDQMST
jgi:hypothetical protein